VQRRRALEDEPRAHAMIHHGLKLEEYRAFLHDLYDIVWHFCPAMAAAAARCGDEFRNVRYALYERGSIVDEYQSVPEYYGPVPPGDVVALGANATVVSRLTGAEPSRVRAVARTAASPDELPPAPELLQQIAELLGLSG